MAHGRARTSSAAGHTLRLGPIAWGQLHVPSRACAPRHSSRVDIIGAGEHWWSRRTRCRRTGRHHPRSDARTPQRPPPAGTRSSLRPALCVVSRSTPTLGVVSGPGRLRAPLRMVAERASTRRAAPHPHAACAK